MSENEEPVGVDLTSWEPPPPPAGLADAVIAKMREPVHAAAVEPEAPSRWRWYAAGGAVAAAAVVAIVLAMRGGEPMTGEGVVAVAKPSRIDLGEATSADLEANTDVRWVRDGHRIVAMQPRGTVSWRVAPEDKLVIDAGATVASVVATGASLRVEVHPMHVTEARMMVGSAVVSAAVALVTVKVYEGRVEVTGSGTTTTVAPGATVEIRPYVPPKEPIPVAKVPRLEPDKVGDVVLGAGGSKCMHDYNGRLDVHLSIGTAGKATEWLVVGVPQQTAIEDCFATAIKASEFGINVGASYSLTVAVNPDVYAIVNAEHVTDEQVRLANQKHQKDMRDDAKRRFDELERKLQEAKNEELPAGAPGRKLTATDIENKMAANRDALLSCGDTAADGKVKVIMNVERSGAVTDVRFEPASTTAATCLRQLIKSWSFGRNTGGTFAYTVVFEGHQPKTVPANFCADAMVRDVEAKGDAAQAAGNYAASLQKYKSIFKCKPGLATKLYLSACRARSFADAKTYYRILGKESLAQICMKEGFDPRTP